MTKTESIAIASVLRTISDPISVVVRRAIKQASGLWIVSGVVVTLISLIALPLILEATHYLITGYFGRFMYYDSTYNLQFKSVIYAYGYYFSYYFQALAFILILVIYPPYPAPYPIKKYFEKRGYRAAIAEYEMLKKILYVTAPFLIIFTIIVVLDNLDSHKPVLPNPIHLVMVGLHPYVDNFMGADYLLILVASAVLLVFDNSCQYYNIRETYSIPS